MRTLASAVDCSAMRFRQVDNNTQVGHWDGCQACHIQIWQLTLRLKLVGCSDRSWGDGVTSEDLPVDVAIACPHRCWSNWPNYPRAFTVHDDTAVAIRSQPFIVCQALGVAGQVGGLDAAESAPVVVDDNGEFTQEAEQHGQACCIEGILTDSRWKGGER